jgi:hypothetical protein
MRSRNPTAEEDRLEDDGSLPLSFGYQLLDGPDGFGRI